MVLVPQNPTINNVLYSNTIFAGTLPRFQTYPYYHPTPILLPSLIVTSHSTNGNYPQTYIPIIAIVRICRYYSTILGCCHSICIDAQHESSLYPIAYIYIIHTYIPNHVLWVLQSIHHFFIVFPYGDYTPPSLVLLKSCHLSTNLSSLLCWWWNHIQWLCLMVICQLLLAKVLLPFLVNSLCLMVKSQ